MNRFVDNKVVFEGDEEFIIEVEKYVRSDAAVFDFRRIFTLDLSDGFSAEKVIKKWGTPSNTLNAKITERTICSVSYEFQTEWTPPYLIYCELCRLFEFEMRYWYYASLDRQIAGVFNGVDPVKEKSVFESLLLGCEGEVKRLEKTKEKLCQTMGDIKVESADNKFVTDRKMIDDESRSILSDVLPLCLDDLLKPKMSLEDLGWKVLDELYNSGCYTAYVLMPPGDTAKNDEIYSTFSKYVDDTIFVLERCREIMVLHMLDEKKHVPGCCIGSW